MSWWTKHRKTIGYGVGMAVAGALTGGFGAAALGATAGLTTGAAIAGGAVGAMQGAAAGLQSEDQAKALAQQERLAQEEIVRANAIPQQVNLDNESAIAKLMKKNAARGLSSTLIAKNPTAKATKLGDA